MNTKNAGSPWKNDPFQKEKIKLIETTADYVWSKFASPSMRRSKEEREDFKQDCMLYYLQKWNTCFLKYYGADFNSQQKTLVFAKKSITSYYYETRQLNSLIPAAANSPKKNSYKVLRTPPVSDLTFEEFQRILKQLNYFQKFPQNIQIMYDFAHSTLPPREFKKQYPDAAIFNMLKIAANCFWREYHSAGKLETFDPQILEETL